jgi:hypothetical protein
MPKRKSIALLSLLAVLLWLPALVSRANGQVATSLMIVAAVAGIGVLWKGFESRKQSLLVSGAVVLATAWISIGTWNVLLHAYPLTSEGIDPFAGPTALWAILTFVLGLTIFGFGFWMLVKRNRPYRILAFATGATLLFTSNYFFQLTAGV